MSILRTLNTGASGLAAHGDALGVVSDNIANANTIGFKRSRAQFEDVLGMTAAQSNGATAGVGSRLGHVEAMWAQGALLTTDQPTDLALSGKGFFVVKGKVDGTVGNYFTRAGQFHVNADGYMVNQEGLTVQGYMTDASGRLAGNVSDLRISTGTMAATPTSAVTMSINFDSNAKVPDAWDAANPAGTSNFSSGATVYDSLGNARPVTVYYRKSGLNQWEWHAMADGKDLTNGTEGVPVEGASGTLTFTTSGQLDTETISPGTWDFKDAEPGQAVSFDFGQSLAEGAVGLGQTTQLGDASSTNGVQQNGSAGGSVIRVEIGGDGTITGVFTNGQRRALGQVAVAEFQSEHGLARAGAGIWAETKESGSALIGGGEAGGRGSIVSGALEQSNVDMGREFVDLIAYQRGFQASSKVVQTADEMYGELVNLRR